MLSEKRGLIRAWFEELLKAVKQIRPQVFA